MTEVIDDANESSSAPPLEVAAPNAATTTSIPGHSPTRMSVFDEEDIGGQRVPSPSLPARPLTPFVLAESPPAEEALSGHPHPDISYDDRRPTRRQRTAAPPLGEASSSTDRGAAYPIDFRVGQDVHFILPVASFGLRAPRHAV